LGKVLCRQGFQTVEAGDGDSALGMAKGLDGKLLVLVTDIDMPGTMNGVELAKLVRSAFPAIPVVFISVLPVSCTELETLGPDCVFLQKPFDSKTLVGTIQALTCSSSSYAL
jgi:CheY-like chemotaxis protein